MFNEAINTIKKYVWKKKKLKRLTHILYYLLIRVVEMLLTIITTQSDFLTINPIRVRCQSDELKAVSETTNQLYQTDYDIIWLDIKMLHWL